LFRQPNLLSFLSLFFCWTLTCFPFHLKGGFLFGFFGGGVVFLGLGLFVFLFLGGGWLLFCFWVWFFLVLGVVGFLVFGFFCCGVFYLILSSYLSQIIFSLPLFVLRSASSFCLFASTFHLAGRRPEVSFFFLFWWVFSDDGVVP